MAAQGEETVYPAPPQLGKICLFNGDLRGGAGAEKRGWTGDARFSNDRAKEVGDALNALG